MPDPPQLRLDIAALQREIEAAGSLAGPFLMGVGAERLRRAQKEFLLASERPDANFTWQVPREEPIWTKPSPGEYEQKGEGEKHSGPVLLGALSFKWQLRTGPKRSKSVYIAGNATTMLRLHDREGAEQDALSMWRMEIGAHDSPGCCFHTQVLGTESHPPFPKEIPVPRLPSFPPTPMASLEFLLSELFQIGWRRQVERGTGAANIWRAIQAKRLRSVLNWQLEQIAQSTGSPLVRLKAFPDPDVLYV
jgi:hypothetical protein